ncbi:hypothetical protein JB92DRAFT_3100132 [Gautieria morchelliformis]|nr:hypothetical protein JB92DRAFT_3100132 [Gautieria morchelliformis]
MQLLPNSSARGNFAVSGQLWFDSPNVFIVTAPSAAFVWAPMTLMGNVASSRRFERGLAHLDGDRADAAHSEPLRLLQLADTVNLVAASQEVGQEAREPVLHALDGGLKLGGHEPAGLGAHHPECVRCLVHVEPEKLSAGHGSRTGTKDRAAVPAAGQD